MSRSSAVRVAGGTAAPSASRMRRYGQRDTQLGAELPLEEAQAMARAYKRALVEKGLARFYGVRIERRAHGMAAVMLGRHDDKPMPQPWVS